MKTQTIKISYLAFQILKASLGTIFISIILCSLDSSFAADNCDLLLARLNQARQEWRDFSFTDPRSHRPDASTYLVHGFQRDYLDRSSLQYFRMRTEMMSRRKFMNDAAAMVESRTKYGTGSLSTYLFQPNLGMWGPSGVILKIAPENLYAAYPGDMGYMQKVIGSHANLLHYFEEYGLPPPQNFLDIAPRGSYNEIVIGFGLDLGPQISIEGFLHGPEASMYPHFEDQLQDYANSLNVPIVRVPP